MSKKMLKRSLALGALMAFVITGSALAAEAEVDKVVLGEDEQLSKVLQQGSTYTNGNDVCVVNGAIYRHKGNGDNKAVVDLNSKKLIINKTDDLGYGNAPLYGYFEIIDTSDTTKGILEVVGGVICSDDSVINVGELIITSSTGNAIYRPENCNGSANINANKMVVDAETNAFQVHSDLYLGSEEEPVGELEITAGGSAITVASNTEGKGATLQIYADELNIAKNPDGIIACSGGSINLKANQGNINSDIFAGGVHSGKGTVDLTLGSGVNWTGKVITDVTDFGDKYSSATVDLSGTWNLTKASSLTNATFNAGSVLKIKGADFVESTGNYVLKGVGDKDVLTVKEGAKLTVEGIAQNTYNIAKGFETITGADKWEITDLNTLMEGEWVEDTENKTLQLEVVAKNTSDMATETGISTSTAGLVQGIIDGANSDPQAKVEGTPQYAAAKFIESVLENNPTDAAVGNAINAATKMGEAGGNSATAASIVKNVTGVTNDRLSFNCGHSAPHKGGHGVGLFEEGSGADVWVEYVHGKDEVEDMPSTAGASSYEGQYNGIVMGVDFKKVNKFQSGIAFNYGEGDTNSVGNAVRTHSDYDFWGVGYYGNIHNDDSNIIFDINYAQTDSDVTQNNSTTVFEASPETTTWSAGIKLEKLYQNENVQIVPYTGLRYMSIDSDDYATKDGAFMYSMDRQDIWLLPLGVSIRQEIANDNGWTVSPRVDLSYIWAFGDTNSNMEVKSPFAGVSQLGYDVMDDGSFLGLVGIEAHKGQWGYGVAYSYQKGNHSESKKWYVDVNYSF